MEWKNYHINLIETSNQLPNKVKQVPNKVEYLPLYLKDLEELENQYIEESLETESRQMAISTSLRTLKTQKKQIDDLKDKIYCILIEKVFESCDQELMHSFGKNELEVFQKGLSSIRSMDLAKDLNVWMKKVKEIKLLYPTWEFVHVTGKGTPSYTFKSAQHNLCFTCFTETEINKI